MVKVREDITGWVMSEHGVPDSRLTVIEQTEDYIRPDGRYEARWLCECSCEEHNRIAISKQHLTSGSIKSCGCLRKETTSTFNSDTKHKINKYDISGEFGIGWTSNTNREFYFDLNDYNKIKDYCWCEIIRSSGTPALETRNPKTKKQIAMHTLLGYQNYDHINRNELDNRKQNLRPCSKKENSRNRSLPKNNTSGIIGVGWYEDKNSWRARIEVDGKSIHLGYYAKKDDAIKIRLQAENKYFGEFAPQRHLFEQYEIITIQND